MEQSVRVLHVDDKAEIAKLASTFLERENDRIQVHTATSTAEGLEYVREETVDCIISDYDMPDQTGVQFLKTVRADYPELPFILYTGKGSEAVASKAISAGVTDYLQKETGTDQYAILANRVMNAVEHYRSQQNLKRVKRRYEAVFEDPNILVGLLTPEGIVRDINQTAMEYVDSDLSDIVGEPFWETPWWGNNDAMRSTVEEWIERAADGEYVEFETTVVGPDGNRTVNGVFRPVTDTEGTVHSLIVSDRDVTERKRQQAQLEETLRTLEAVFEHSPDMITMHDTEGRLLQANQRFADTVGYSKDEVLDKYVWDIDHTVTPAEARSFWTELRPNEPRVFEGEYLCKDGSTFPVEVHLVRLTIGGEDQFLAISHDITERKEREQRFQAVFEEAFDAMVIADDAGEYTEVNPAACELFGVPEDELLGRSIAEFAPDDFDFETAWDEFQSSDRERGVFPLERPDGSTVFVEYAASSDIIPGEHLSVLRDITDRKREQQERARRTAELQAKNERLEEFASIVSHDLRNPLNVLLGELELAEETGESEHFVHARRAGERMHELIDDLLSLAQQGDTVSEFESIALGELVDASWRNIETADATLQHELTCTVRADPSRLQQVLENLFRNAVEHGGDSVSVTVGELADGFYVQDDGSGVPEDEQTNVFDPGYSTAQEGTGFGLPIVKEIVEAHDWKIHLTTGSDGGARFEIEGVEKR